MSIRIMSQVWADGPEDKAQLLVLLALADFADDAGNCWPSVEVIGRKARMSERNARRVIRDLEEAGYIGVVTGGGRHGCSQYQVINPDRMSPRTECPPGQNKHNTRTKPAQYPDTAMSAEPSRTIKEPSDIKVGARDIARALEDWASPDAVASFIAYRKRTKAKALTLTAAKRLAESLKAIMGRNGDPDDALGMAEERGWLSIQPDWYFNAKGRADGNGSQQDRPEDRQLRLIAAAARTR